MAERANMGHRAQQHRETISIADARLPVTPENYRRKFLALIHFEEIEHIRLLAEKCDGQYCINAVTGNQLHQISKRDQSYCDACFCISGMTPQQIMYASQASSEIRINCSSTLKDVCATVVYSHEHYRSGSSVLYIGTKYPNDTAILKKYLSNHTKIMINFLVKHSYFQNLIKCVHKISDEAIRRIVPSEKDFERGLDYERIPRTRFRHNRLDNYQFRALQTMVFSRGAAPVLVPGPFGSGKTRLLSVATEHLIKNAKSEGKICRILLCCHEQKSADVFMGDYFLKMIDDQKNSLGNHVYRIVSKTYGKRLGKYCELFINEFMEKDLRLFDHLVVVTTFLTALQIVDRIPRGYFTHILIDEGAQAREPECIAPLCMADSNTRIMIVGDSKQVGPKLLVLGKIAQENGLAQSLLERLHDSYMRIPEAKKHSVVHLRNNYRCVANILKVPSELFYDSRLIPRSRKTNGVKGFPLQFICSSTSDKTSFLSDSKPEANIVVQAVNDILSKMDTDPSQICVLSSSQRQMSLIRNMTMGIQKLQGIKILSSYQMQGQEFDVLILSTVESVHIDGRPFDPLKSFAHPAVFNTAITRARSLIVAVGNPFTLRNCERAIQGSSRCWDLFISTCEKNATFFSKQPAAAGSNVVRNDPRTRDDSSIHSESTRNKVNLCQPSLMNDSTDSSFTSLQGTPQYRSSITAEDTRRVHREYPAPNQSSHKLNQQKTQQKAVTGVAGVSPIKNSSAAKHNESRLIQVPKIPDCTPVRHSTQSVPQRNLLPNKISKDAVPPSSRAPQLPRPPEPVTRLPAVIQTSGLVADALGHTHRPYIPHLLKEPLTRFNYREKFHHLLCREEEEHARILKERCDGIYDFYIYKLGFRLDERFTRDHKRRTYARFGYITASHLDGDKIAYAVQASEGQLDIKFERQDKTVVVKKLDIIHSDDSDKILLGLDTDYYLPPVEQLVTSKAEVNFILKFSYFDRLHSAVDALPNEVIRKIMPESPHNDFSFPHDIPPHVKLPTCLELSKGQKYACNAILGADPSKAPVLIAGSFGTGKTRLITSAAYQILKGSPRARVLVCAHHQKSVDSFMINYFGKEINWEHDHIFRLVPGPHYRVPDEKFRKYYVTAWDLGKFPKEKIRLVFASFSSTNHLRKSFKNHFTHIFIDEGAQAREPESIMPLCLANKDTSIVIAGDHKQVGPSVLVLGHDAREYGLKCSLLERLHKLYSTEKFFKRSSSHCVSLWTNFRSHHALLCLPSYLFYGSALVTAAESAYQSHPDGQYPIQFVCSSLDDSVCEVKESSNQKEVELILDEVKSCIENWPSKEWGRLDLNEICVMATTPNQKAAFLQTVWSNPKYRSIKYVRFLTVYDIQGSEFRAIFLSTAEPIDEQGKSKNPTKSPCGQFVFNTAITRAKSLIVCAGNPFLLMKVEKCTEQVDHENSFWKDYLRRCLITMSLKIPQKIPQNKNGRDKLQHMLFSEESKSYANQTSEVTKANDSIITRLEDFVSKRHNVKNCKLEIREQQKESQNWELIESQEPAPHRRKHDASISGKEFTCLLQIKGPRNAVAIPQQSSRQDSIIINGYGSRIGAFDGDIVTVCVLGSDENGQRYGKVVGVREFQHPTKYICKADLNNCINFFPIDRRVPSIVNLPKVSRSILERNPREFSELQKDYISVFEESSLNIDEDLSLRIKELIPFEMASSVLFVVKILSWSPNFRKPLGAVVAVIPRTNNLFINEKLLLVAHDIQHNQSMPSIEELIKDEQVEDRHLKTYSNGITIDPSDAINFDDALAIVPGESEDTLELTVFITDVAHYIPKDSKLDCIAKSRGTSVYPGQIKHTGPCTALHMLPHKLATQKLSLCGDNSRHVIAITASVKVSNGEVIEVKRGTPSEALLKNSINLTYNSSQCIMNGNKLTDVNLQQLVKKFNSSSASHLPLNETLTLLFKVAMKIRIDRLADAAFNYKLSCDADEKDWQSHLMVEELMIWANRQVAEYMIQECPETAIIRSQFPPLEKEVNDLREAYKQILPFSLCYKSLCSAEELEVVADQSGGLVLSSQILEMLSSAYRKKDLMKIVRILSREMNFSQLAMIEGAVNSISQSAQYACAKSLIAHDNDSASDKHFGLKCRYTHFSSPIRRYFDIVVQRIVKALIGQKDMPYNSSELQKLCQLLDLKIKNSNRYSRDIDRALIASQLEDEGMEEVTAYVACSLQKKHKLHLCFPSSHFSDFMNRDDTSFDVSELNYHKREEKDITWQVVVVPLSSGPPLCLTQLCNPGGASLNVKFFPKINEESDARNLKTWSKEFKETTKLVRLESWGLAQKFVKNPTQENLKKFMQKLNYQTVAAAPLHLPDRINESPLIQYTVKKEFGEGSPVKVWISKSFRNPISSPGLGLIEVAPTVTICLQHMQNPAMCFSNTNLVSSKSQYKSKAEYVDLWSKALLAEACHDGVNTRKVIILKDASLSWPKLVRRDTSIDEICFEPEGDLSLTICLDKYDMMDIVGIRSGDLVCARYEIRDSEGEVRREIYHFCVSRVQKPEKGHQGIVRRNEASKNRSKIEKVEDPTKKNDLIIYLHSYGEHGCIVSDKMRQKFLKSNPIPPCELQIMNIPRSTNRLFERLQIPCKVANLSGVNTSEVPEHKTWIKLALDLGLGINYEKFDSQPPKNMDVYLEVYDKDRFAKCLWDRGTSKQLNLSQLEAIAIALEYRFQLIQGPPGTGKSVTGAHLAYIFAMSNRRISKGECVLYCGPSNKAVDVVHDQLLKLNNLLVDVKRPKLKIIRLYGRAHEGKDPVLEALHMNINENTEGMCTEKFKKDALHFKIRETSAELKDLEQKIQTMSKDNKIPSPATRALRKTCEEQCEEMELKKSYDIILCTCNETCSSRLLKASLIEEEKNGIKVKRLRIAQCIVDECGMATEPETLAAISRCEHAVLIGDHKQLQPVVKYKAAQTCGLGRSLFERYAEWEVSKNDLFTLDIQYRMHPGICERPSQIFYDGHLDTAASVKRRSPLGTLNNFFGRQGRYPVRFYDVIGNEESGLKDQQVHKASVDAHSKFNAREAKEIVKVVRRLKTKYSINEKSIAVLTPYAAQKAKVKELLNEAKFREVKVLSVVESQGDEYDVVILSTVRSQPRDQIMHREYIQPDLKWKRENLGFLTDPHQLNVAITRAKYGLIIIGDRVLLEYDDNWKKLIAKYEENDCIINSR